VKVNTKVFFLSLPRLHLFNGFDSMEKGLKKSAP
jgi:hypothetical protein